MNSPLPPPPPSTTPSAPFFIDYDETSLTVQWEGVKENKVFYHVQLGQRLSGESKETEGDSKSQNEEDIEWTSLAQRFGSSRVKKKNLIKGETYWFRYRVRDEIDYTTRWSEVSEGLKVLGEGLVSPKPREKVGKAGSVFLEWDGVDWEGVEGYEIWMRPEDGGFELIGTVKSTEVRKKNLTQDAKYYFQIRVKLSSNSDPLTVQTSPSSDPISPSRPITQFVAQNFPEIILTKLPRSVKANNLPLASGLPADKIILLYFSAHWCGPCRQFTPKLVQFYNQFSAKYNFEVCFVSADHDEKSFRSYYEEEMPWKAIPYDDDKREMLQSMYKVSGIPSLKVLKSDGTVIDNNATSSPLNEAAAQAWVNGGACKKGCCH
ncbi:hypothetical protein TrLO_g10864 [Triparma laevis f. longispina]|uniref:protein-disulfide reductase n=1 Tax=Triparma laevis f. longispina TaxID=1714387 RepID=A0A9W7CEP0_9STRA|nr:hypothetical protein TrLO_g10864 [Triparma laevis f. longispina]